MDKNIPNTETEKGQNALPYKHCLNCGTELKGLYCHNCGQEAVAKRPTVLGLVVEYLNEIFVWDSKFLFTFWTLIRRPGELTNDYLAGKYVSQESPLKLNMFLLFVFVSLFLFFTGIEKVTTTGHNLANDERVVIGVQLDSFSKNGEYTKVIEEGPRDTVLLHLPLFLVEEYPEIVTCIEVKEDTNGEGIDKLLAVVPRVLIEDEIIVADDSGYYRFNTEKNSGEMGLEYINDIWSEMVDIASRYFPMLLLLTTPFLSISLMLVQRKSKLPYINHFIFSLHYTALLESLMICIYIIHLIFSLSMGVLEAIMIVGSCSYLTIAFRKVYAVNSWWRSIVRSLLTSCIYILILLSIFVVIFFVACFTTVINNS